MYKMTTRWRNVQDFVFLTFLEEDVKFIDTYNWLPRQVKENSHFTKKIEKCNNLVFS